MNLFEYTKIIFKSDPCKKCIVRACCTQFCKEKHRLNIYQKDGVKFKKLVLITFWLSILAVPIMIGITWYLMV